MTDRKTKNQSYGIRFSDDEYDLMVRRAMLAGKEKSEFIRNACLDRRENIICFVNPDTEELKEVIGELGKICEILNEIKTRLKRNSMLTELQEKEINNCISDMFKIMEQVEKYGDAVYGRT